MYSLLMSHPALSLWLIPNRQVDISRALLILISVCFCFRRPPKKPAEFQILQFCEYCEQNIISLNLSLCKNFCDFLLIKH